MSGYRPPQRQPRNSSHLQRLIGQYSRASGIAVSRVQRWIWVMVLLGALERVREEDKPSRFLIKGGMALEIRLGLRARATRDLDAVFLQGSIEELRDDLDAAFAEPYCGFQFRFTEFVQIRDTGAYRFDVRLAYEGRDWGTLNIELSPPEGGGRESDRVEAIAIDEFGLEGPEWVDVLSLRYQIAQKLHACTEQFADGSENTRVRDVIDLLLVREHVEGLAQVRAAVREVFEIRGKQAWPPTIVVPDSWPPEYERLARELEFPIGGVTEATAELRVFINAIDAATE